MKRDHPGSTDNADRLGRRPYLKMAGATVTTAGGLFTGIGSAAETGGRWIINIDYDDYGSATDVYSIERPEYARFVNQESSTAESVLELEVPRNESWGTNTTFDLPANGLGEPKELYQSIQMRLDSQFSFQNSGDNCRVFNAGLNSDWGSAGSGTNGPPSGTDGWSSRLYVMANGSRGGPFGLNVYTYHMDQQSGPGDEEIVEDALFSPGEWHDVETYVRLNTVDGNQANADGVVRVWIDGTKVYDRSDFRWTTDPEQAHHRAGPVTHWGGPELPTRDSWVYYRDHQLAIDLNPRK